MEIRYILFVLCIAPIGVGLIIGLCALMGTKGEEPKPKKYYTPQDIAEFVAGSGGFLNNANNKIIGNPPYDPKAKSDDHN
jgi:hypothetical protein